jgi:hypothetical protein
VVPAVVFVGNIAAVVVLCQGNYPAWLGFLVTGVEALAILGVGYLLRDERASGEAHASAAA